MTKDLLEVREKNIQMKQRKSERKRKTEDGKGR